MTQEPDDLFDQTRDPFSDACVFDRMSLIAKILEELSDADNRPDIPAAEVFADGRRLFLR